MGDRKTKTVCAIIVTYNRPELLCRCVKAAMEQKELSHILIYDNHSTINTKEYLINNGCFKSDLMTYFYASENTGGSGGFHYGMKMAYEAGFDELLLMDDDGYPVNKNTLERLLSARERVGDETILNSLVVCDEKTLRLSFSLNKEYDGKELQRKSKNGLLKGQISPFNGTLVSSKIVKRIGLPKKEYFVYGDETEYFFRALTNGVSCYTVTDSIYYHPTNATNGKKVLGIHIPVNDVPMWKVYCSSRNSANYIHHYFGLRGLLKHVARLYIGVAISDKNRAKKFKTVSIGIIDGITNDFSKDVFSF